MLNVIQTIYVEEGYKDVPSEVRQQHREDLRNQMAVYMYRRDQETKTEGSSGLYLEPNDEGFYPGLEDGRLDA